MGFCPHAGKKVRVANHPSNTVLVDRSKKINCRSFLFLQTTTLLQPGFQDGGTIDGVSLYCFYLNAGT